MHALLIGLGMKSDDGPPLIDRYAAVDTLLQERGFCTLVPMLYFGNDRVTSVDCILAVQELKRAYDWSAVDAQHSDPRIEENTDLGPALG